MSRPSHHSLLDPNSVTGILHAGRFARGPILILIPILILFPILFLSGCGATTQDDPLLISAAANLQPALATLTPGLEQAAGMKVVFNYGASGKLAQQIEQGAPADLFLSANRGYVDELIPAGSLIPDSVTPFARGRLVVWTKDAALPLQGFSDLARPELRRIAMPNPDHAPYGAAARQALQAAGLWDAVQPKLVFGENVTQSYQFAQRGDVDAAFVSASQIIEEKGRWIDAPVEGYQPLDQTAAVTARAAHPDAARAIIRFLLTPAAQAIFRQYGYLSIEASS